MAPENKQVPIRAGFIAVLNKPVREAFRDVEWLREKGVGISQAREIALLLKARGFNIPQDINRYEELLPLLITIAKGGRL